MAGVKSVLIVLMVLLSFPLSSVTAPSEVLMGQACCICWPSLMDPTCPSDNNVTCNGNSAVACTGFEPLVESSLLLAKTSAQFPKAPLNSTTPPTAINRFNRYHRPACQGLETPTPDASTDALALVPDGGLFMAATSSAQVVTVWNNTMCPLAPHSPALSTPHASTDALAPVLDGGLFMAATSSAQVVTVRNNTMCPLAPHSSALSTPHAFTNALAPVLDGGLFMAATSSAKVVMNNTMCLLAPHSSALPGTVSTPTPDASTNTGCFGMLQIKRQPVAGQANGKIAEWYCWCLQNRRGLQYLPTLAVRLPLQWYAHLRSLPCRNGHRGLRGPFEPGWGPMNLVKGFGYASIPRCGVG